jgi:hypothetical protein
MVNTSRCTKVNVNCISIIFMYKKGKKIQLGRLDVTNLNYYIKE